MDDQYGFDINLDFFDSSTTNIKPNVANTALYQHDQEEPALDIESLATRIASVNELALQLKATKQEHVKLQKQMQDLSDSAMSIRIMYEREKTEKAKYALLSKELKEKCGLAESQLTNKTLHFEQLTSQFEQSAPKGHISYNELALRYQRLALQLDEDKQLHSKEKIPLQQMQEYIESKKLTALPAFKKKCNLKAEMESQGSCKIALPTKTELRNQGTQYTRYTTTRGTNTPAKSPQKETRTQGTQYISSMTTRGTSTSTFIKQHTIGTNFPEVIPVSIEDIFKEMICDVSPLSPILASPPAVAKMEIPRVKRVEMKSVSTNTGLRNVRKQIDYVSANIKYSDSRPPSRNMNDRVKSEWPFVGMPSMNPFSGLGISPPPMHSTVAELWNMLGHTIFALLQNGNSQINTMHATAVNDRLRNISADINRRKEQPRANDEQPREGNNYFEEERGYGPSTKNTATSPMMDPGNSQDFGFDGAYMNSEPPSPAFVLVGSHQEKVNPPVEIQKILLNKNVQTNASSEKKTSRVDGILQLFPQDTRSLENRKAIKRLLKSSTLERKSKKMSFEGSNGDDESSTVSVQTNWEDELFGTSGDESTHSDSSFQRPMMQQSSTRTFKEHFTLNSPNEGTSLSSSSAAREMSYEPPGDDVFLGFDEDSDEAFCKPFAPPKQSQSPNPNHQRERTTIQQLPSKEEDDARSSFSAIPFRENRSKAKRKRRASRSVTKQANKVSKGDANSGVAGEVAPSTSTTAETSSSFDLQFQRTSNFSRLTAPLRKQPASSNSNGTTTQRHQNSEQTRPVSSPLFTGFSAPTQTRSQSKQGSTNFNRTTTLGQRKSALVTTQTKSNLMQFVKCDSPARRDMTSPNPLSVNGFLSPRAFSLQATTVPRQYRSPNREIQSKGPLSVPNQSTFSNLEAQSEENFVPNAQRISHFNKFKAEENIAVSRSPCWDTDTENDVIEDQSELDSNEFPASSIEKTTHMTFSAERAAPRDDTVDFHDLNTLNSYEMSADSVPHNSLHVEQNQPNYDEFKVPGQEESPMPPLCDQMTTNSHLPKLSGVKTPCWDSEEEEETSNPAFHDQLDETLGQGEEKMDFIETKQLKNEDTKMIVPHDPNATNTCEPEIPNWHASSDNKAESTTFTFSNPNQAQSPSSSSVSISEFNGLTTPKEEKPSNVPLPDDNTTDSHELNISSSSSSADLSIDCPPSPKPHDTSSLDLSLLLKTPEKENPPTQFKTPPESCNRNTSLLNKVLTSSTENLVEEFLNENSGADEPKFQMFLSKIMGEVAPPISPISVLAPSEKPLDSETESSCDEDGSEPPRRNKTNPPATAAIAAKRSARLKAKIDGHTEIALPLLNIPGIELGKYTKRRNDQRTPLNKPKAEVKEEKAEKKFDIIGDIRLGFFKDLMEEHDSSTEDLVIDDGDEEVEQPKEEVFKNAKYPQASYGNLVDPVCGQILNQNLEEIYQMPSFQPAGESSSAVALKYETICKQNTEEINIGSSVSSELDSYQGLPSTSSSAMHEQPQTTLFVGQILERTKEGSWQPRTSDPICFDECPASPPPEEQTPDESHITRQCAESAPLLGRPTSNLAVLSHIIANYNQKYHKLLKPVRQPDILNQLQSALNSFINGLCLIMDTVRTVDTLLNLTTNEKLIAEAFVFVAKNAPRPETEVPPQIPEHCISQALNKLCCIIEQLRHQLPALRRNIQATIEQSLFSFAKDVIPLEVLMNLTQFYLAIIAESNATNNPARLFICKCLYFYNQKATPMIYQTLCVYPSVLPKRDDSTYDRSDALISAIQCILMSTYYDMEKTDLKTKQMLTKLRKFYNYESFKPPRDEFLDNLIAKIRAGRFKNVSYAFALICKRMEQRNTEKGVLGERLLPLANEYYQALGQTRENDLKIACVLECISFIIKPFAVETDISAYVNLFGRFLNASDRQIIQEAALAALLRTIRFGYVNCFNAIYNFKPNYELADETKAMLRSFVYKKTLIFLKRLEHQARMLGAT